MQQQVEGGGGVPDVEQVGMKFIMNQPGMHFAFYANCAENYRAEAAVGSAREIERARTLVPAPC